MIPIADDDSDRTVTPFVNYLLIVANIAVGKRPVPHKSPPKGEG